MTTQAQEFVSLVDELEATGRVPDSSQLPPIDRAALDVAQRLFAEQTHGAPPARNWSSEVHSRGRIVGRIGPSSSSSPTVAETFSRSPRWARWLSGGVAAAAVLGLLAVTRLGTTKEPAPVAPSQDATPAGLELMAPTAPLPTEPPRLNELVPRPSERATATSPTNPVQPDLAPTEIVASDRAEAESEGSIPNPSVTTAPPTAESAEVERPAATEAPTNEPVPAATAHRTTTPPPLQTTAPSSTPLPATSEPPTQASAPNTATTPPQPPPIQTMMPLPTEVPDPAPSPRVTP
jgi:hypothetical protein